MSSKGNAEILISAYKRADADANELLSKLDKINSIDDIKQDNLPGLVYELQDQKSFKTQDYLACAAITGGGVATAVGTTLACGALTAGAYGVTATTVGIASTYGALASGVGAAIPGIGFLALPIISIPMIIKLINESKVKKYRKDNISEFQNKKSRMEKARGKLQTFIDEIQKKLHDIDVKLQEELGKKIKEYQEKAKKLAKEVAIEIDDIVNAGANERIMKYNEIILKQYKLQKELEDKLDYLYSEYDKLLKEKTELERKIGILMQLLNTMGCPEAVINQALSE